jgi:hypothetical protein
MLPEGVLPTLFWGGVLHLARKTDLYESVKVANKPRQMMHLRPKVQISLEE